MEMVTTRQALEILQAAGLKVPYSTLALWVRQGKFDGAQLDETNPRGPVWLIPRRSVEAFRPPRRGRRPTASKKAPRLRKPKQSRH